MKAEYVSHMGDDLFIVNVARVSFDKESSEFTLREAVEKGSDEGLIEFLAKHNHWTPFAHAQVSLRMKAPIPIRTQAFKHKQGLIENEESRRYIDCKPEVYIPDTFRKRPEGSIKQGSGEIHPQSDSIKSIYTTHTKKSVEIYLGMIEEGVCPEQARFILPQGCMVNGGGQGHYQHLQGSTIRELIPMHRKKYKS